MNEQLAEGTVTLLFTDIEGSTDLGRQSGDLSARRIFRAHDEVVRAQLAEHGGTEIKSLGDGFMIAFSSARRAIACAAAIQRDLEGARKSDFDGGVRVRMGLNAGEVIYENGDVFGSAVNAAARIAGHARGGQILVSEVVKALVGSLSDMPIRDIGKKELKGFDEDWRLFEVQWRREAPTGSVARRTPFVGRHEERAELISCLDRLEESTGGLVLIGGEPGVGKTRLAEEVAAEAVVRGYRTLTGRSYDMDAPPPYLPFVELLEAAAKEVDRETFRIALGESAGEISKIMPQLRNMYDDIPESLALPPEQERRYLMNSIVEFVERAALTRPLVVLLDDLHWADEPSLALLQRVAQNLERLPVLLIGTYRNVELDTHRPLSRTLDSLMRGRLARRITLKRLSLEGVGAMLERLGHAHPPQRLVEIIYEETDGNAFFVEEVFRHLDEEGRLFDPAGKWRSDLEIGEVDVPEGVRLVIGRRLEGLAKDERKVLAAAAIIGRTFDYALLESLEEVEEDAVLDAVEEAQRLSLIAPLSVSTTETRYEFVHELIRQTLLSGMAAPRRQRLHMRVAQAMERLYEATLAEQAPQIVNHLYQAGSVAPQLIVRYLLLAGERAQSIAAFEEAQRYFEEALEACDEGNEESKARALLGLGQAKTSLGRLDDAIEDWRSALTIWERSGDAESIANVALEMVLQLGWAGKWDGVVEIAARGLAAMGDDPTAEKSMLMSFAAVGLGWAGAYDNAMPMLEEAVSIARSTGDNTALGRCLSCHSTVLFAYAFLEQCVDVGKQAMELLREPHNQWQYASSLAFVVFALGQLGRTDEIGSQVDELEELATKLGFGGGLLFAVRSRYFERAEPDLDRFEDISRRDMQVCEDYDLPWRGQSRVFHGRTQFVRGDVEAALDSARIGSRDEPPGVLSGFGLVQVFLILSYLGRKDEALALWDEVKQKFPVSGVPNGFGSWVILSCAVEGSFVLGEIDLAGRLYPLMREALETEAPFRWDRMPFETLAGVAAAAAGDRESAKRHFERGLELAQGLGYRIEVADTKRLCAMALRVLKEDEGRTRELLNDALAVYQDIGMVFHVSLTRDLLDETGRPLSAAPTLENG